METKEKNVESDIEHYLLTQGGYVGAQSEAQLYKVFQNNVSNFGLLHVLRNGIKDKGMTLKFCYFNPTSDINEELVKKY